MNSETAQTTKTKMTAIQKLLVFIVGSSGGFQVGFGAAQEN